MLFESDSILFKILNEDDADDILNGSMDDDDSAGKNYGADDNNQQQQNQNTDDANNNQQDQNNNDDNAGRDDEQESSDDDFNIDTDIGGDDEGGGDDSGNGGGDIGGGDVGASTEGEVNQANTDIFDTLSAEEQAIKINELKKLYNALYTTINETITKVRSIDNDNIDYTIIYRISATLYDLRDDVATYIFKVFPIKSYYENDVAYNRFLSILNGISSVLGEISTKILGKSK